MFNRLRMHFGITAALLAVLALALPAFASADPLGSFTFFKSGLRAAPNVTVSTLGSDGNVWFVDAKSFSGTTAIGKITSAGAITEYEDGVNLKGLNAESDLVAIATGPEGKLWLTDRGATPAIAVFDPTTCISECTVEEFSIEGKGGNPGAVPQDIISGPGGNLWFTDKGTTPAIGKINPGTKAIEEFSIAGNGGNAGSRPQGIAVGSDGNLWFTDTGTTRAIGRFNPSTPAVEEFATGTNSLPGGNTDAKGPWGIAAGPDGNIWFTENGTEATKGRSATGKAIGRITPSGTKEEIEGSLTYFSTGLLAESHPDFGLTVAPDGKLWFSDDSGVSEKQELEINAAAELGGTYKLGFGGQETGWSGKGNISGFAGTGDVKRAPATGNGTCSFTKESKKITCVAGGIIELAEVGMRITCSSCSSAIPVKTTIAKVEGTTIEMSNAAAATSASKSTIAGWVRNVTYASGKAEVGQQVAGTGLTTSEVVAVGELEGKGTIAPATVPTEVKAGVSLTGGLKTISSVTTTTGCVASGEEVSGAGIPAGTTTTTTSCAPSTLAISKFPTETATGVSLSANLPWNAGASVIRGALKKLPAIGEIEGEANVDTEGTGETAPIKRQIKFSLELGSKNVEQLSCNGAGLTGTSPTCSVTTTTQGLSNSIDSITTSGEIARYPSDELNWGLSDVTNGPGGNVWFGTGYSIFQKIGKLGIEPKLPLEVECTGTGSGTVSTVACGSATEYESGKEVELTATAAKGSEFTGWTKSAGTCTGKTSPCKVTISGFSAIKVTANFNKKGPTNLRTLTLKKSAGGTGGTGTVSSKPKGINCGTACDEAVAEMYENGTVVLKAKASTGSTIASWTGCESSTGVGGVEGTCTVKMPEAHVGTEVKVAWSGTSKEILSAKALTFSKGATEGKGTVKAAGLACEAECSSTTVLYQGPTGVEPKVKPGKTVTLKETAAFGSEFAGWSGCASNPSPSECVVTMESAKSVSAEFALKSPATLTLNKGGTGTGTVSSKPKAINCGATCTTQDATVPEGETIVLKAKASTGMTLSGWSGCKAETGVGGAEGTCTVSLSGASTVTASFSGSPKVIANAQKLTLTKAGSGTVKAAGLTCEVLCTSTVSLYQGPTGVEPKVKPGKTVTLKATSAPGSKAVEWTGCESNPSPSECVVTMETSKSVTATFDELE